MPSQCCSDRPQCLLRGKISGKRHDGMTCANGKRPQARSWLGQAGKEENTGRSRRSWFEERSVKVEGSKLVRFSGAELESGLPGTLAS